MDAAAQLGQLCGGRMNDFGCSWQLDRYLLFEQHDLMSTLIVAVKAVCAFKATQRCTEVDPLIDSDFI